MAVQNPFQHAFELLRHVIEICPDNVWQETSGGWPVWQQICHAVSALDFFVGAPGNTPPPLPVPPAVIGLESQGTKVLSREILLKLTAAAKLRVEAYISTLTDEQLPKKNEGFSLRMGMEVSHGATLACWRHTFYIIWAAAMRLCATMDSRVFFDVNAGTRKQ